LRAFAASINNISGGTLTMDISGTGSNANIQAGKVSPLILLGGIIRGLKLSGNTLLMMTGLTNLGVSLQPLSIRGPSLEPGSGANVTRSYGALDMCLMGTSTLLTFYVDSSNSNYPTARIMALGTVT
jgi:hypothetical protein